MAPRHYGNITQETSHAITEKPQKLSGGQYSKEMQYENEKNPLA